MLLGGVAAVGCRMANPAFLDASDSQSADTEAAAQTDTDTEGSSSGTSSTGVTDEESGSPAELDCDGCELLRLERTFCVCPTPSSWTEARDACVGRGGVLARIATSDENTALVEAGAGLANVNGADLWIGYTDVVDEGIWVWEDGRPTTFENWSDAALDDPGDGEDCAEIQLSNGEWNDSPCSSQQQGFICAE